jgi:hypothetical protein
MHAARLGLVTLKLGFGLPSASTPTKTYPAHSRPVLTATARSIVASS